MSSWKVTLPPAVEPLTLDDHVKPQLRLELDDHNEDADLLRRAKVARARAELYLGRSLITQTITLYLDAFPAGELIYLPRGPVQSVTSVKYIDAAGAQQTVPADQYQLDNVPELARLVPRLGSSWPPVYDQLAAVEVAYVAGYGDTPDDIPEDIAQALLLLVADAYENRESTVLGLNVTEIKNGTALDLLSPYRIEWSFG